MSDLKSDHRPNIVWIISDDTSHAMLGHAGGRVLSPNIDSIAAEGVRFDNFHCVSIACAPSRYNYLTGHYGGRCPADSFRDEVPDGEAYSLQFNTNIDPDRETTVAEVFRSAGYFTGFAGKWHAGPGTADISFAKELNKGADLHKPETTAALRKQQDRFRDILGRAGFEHAESIIWGNHEALPAAARHHNLEYTAKGALNFLDRAAQRDQPFFLNLATNTIHAPDHAASLLEDPRITAEGYSENHLGCLPPRSTIYERITNAGLDFNHITAGVLWMDDCVGAVMERIREMGVEENTIIIFSTDHGPVGGKFTLYQSGVRIPFLVRWKGRLPGGRTTEALAQSIDLAPTLFDYAGIEPPESMVLDGRSLRPAMAGGSGAFDRNELYFEYGYARGLRCGKWKYIAWRLPQRLLQRLKRGEEPFFDLLGNPLDPKKIKPTVVVPTVPRHPHFFEPDQLYDLDTDPREIENLADSPGHADVLAMMKDRLQARLDTFDHPFDVKAPLDPFYSSAHFAENARRVRQAYDKLHEEWTMGKGRISGFVDFVPPLVTRKA